MKTLTEHLAEHWIEGTLFVFVVGLCLRAFTAGVLFGAGVGYIIFVLIP